MTWQIGMVSNAAIAGAYLLIALAIVIPLARSNQLRTNPLGAATAAIFFTCAVHHGTHALHMVLPSFGLADERGVAMRAAWGWPLAIWDVVGMVVALYYWSLRRNYASLMQGAQLFEDLRKREQQALELNDSVLQGLVVAKMALDLQDTDKAHSALSTSIDSASRIITNLLGSEHFTIELLRTAPAEIDLGATSYPSTHERPSP
jgi:signal transduction histidine kinase